MNNFFRSLKFQFLGVFFLGAMSSSSIYIISKLSFNGADKRAELSRYENVLRSDLEGFNKKYGVELKLVRKKEQLILRLWDDQVFSINDWSISMRGQKLIEEISATLQKIDKDVNFEISGHYDSIDPRVGGEEKVNKVAITTHRAAQAAGILAGHGLDMNRIYIKGYGDTKPLFKDRDQYGQYVAQAGELNRRLEIRVLQRAGL
ncbi:MAG: OmpA/MotB family protein [Bdellovibrionales bacterium]